MIKVAIIKTSALGDIVQAFCALRLLRRHHPNMEVTWVIQRSALPILEGEPEVDTLLPVDLKGLLPGPRSLLFKARSLYRTLSEKEYDLVIDLQGNVKSLLLLSLMRSKKKVGFGWKAVPEKINMLGTGVRFDPPPGRSIRDDYLYVLSQALGVETPDWPLPVQRSREIRRVLLCPFSAWPNKELSLEGVLRLIQREQDLGREVTILAATERERTIVEGWKMGITVFAPATLHEFKGGVRDFDLVLAVDSFPLHMADMKGVETFSVFGASLGAKYAPIKGVYFQGKCPYGVTFEKRCPFLRSCKTGACIKEIDFGKIELQ